MPPEFERLDDAREWIEKARRTKEGGHCPCCGIYNKVYPRKLNSGMAWFLVKFYQRWQVRPDGADWLEIKWGQTLNGDYSKLRYWGFIERQPEVASRWRITPAGLSFVEAKTLAPRVAYIFDSECLGFGAEQINIQSALTDKFDYDELMRGYPDKHSPEV